MQAPAREPTRALVFFLVFSLIFTSGCCGAGCRDWLTTYGIKRRSGLVVSNDLQAPAARYSEPLQRASGIILRFIIVAIISYPIALMSITKVKSLITV